MLLLWSATPAVFSGGSNISYISTPQDDNADDDLFLAWMIFLSGGAYE